MTFSRNWYARHAIDRRRWAFVRQRVLARDHSRCRACGRLAWQVDHIIPIGQGGAIYDLENLQVLCGGRGGCHARKTAAENRRVRSADQVAWAALVARLCAEDTID